jgi:hypothetical protein
MILSENEKLAFIREAAKLGAELRRSLIADGATARDANDAMNHFIVYFLATKGVLPNSQDDQWKDQT